MEREKERGKEVEKYEKLSGYRYLENKEEGKGNKEETEKLWQVA